MAPRQVILDTNFLLLPFQFKIDVLGDVSYLLEGNVRYVISSRTLQELKKLGRSIGKHGMAARLALKMMEANKAAIEIVENELPVDEWIVKYAEKHRAVVCTNDAALRKTLKRLGIKTIVLKSKSKLGVG